MAKAIQKIAMNAAENIPYDKLVLSQKNVRRVKDGVSIETARRGHRQAETASEPERPPRRG